jgi:two-component system response regulator
LAYATVIQSWEQSAGRSTTVDGQTILVVEDDPDDEALTIRALKKAGVANNVAVARDGEEALRVLDETEVLPELVLLDLKLPKIGGLEVLQRIRANERTSLLPVVILTSSTEAPDIKSAYSLGANSFVCKPVDFVQFAEAVRQLGLYWLVVNRSPNQ